MNRVFIIFLIWFTANLTFSLELGFCDYISQTDNSETELFDFGFWGITILCLLLFSYYSIPLLFFLLVFYSYRKITHKEFIKQVAIIYSIILAIILIIALITAPTFSLLFLFLSILISIPLIVYLFKYLPGEDVPN